jgi:hypothetical protein
VQLGVLYDCVILTVAVFQAERRISGLTGLMRSQTAPLRTALCLPEHDSATLKVSATLVDIRVAAFSVPEFFSGPASMGILL